MFKVNNKTPERRHWLHSGVFIVNFKHISDLFSSDFIVEFEQLNVSWVKTPHKYADFDSMTNQSLKTRKLNPKSCRFTKRATVKYILQYFSKKVFFKTPLVTASGQISVFCTLHLSHASNWDLRPQACNIIKKETLAQVFSGEFREIFKSNFFT